MLGTDSKGACQWWKTAVQCIATFSPRDMGKLKSTVNLAAKCPECIEDLAMAVWAILEGRCEHPSQVFLGWQCAGKPALFNQLASYTYLLLCCLPAAFFSPSEAVLLAV